MCLLDIILRPVQVCLNFKYRSLCKLRLISLCLIFQAMAPKSKKDLMARLRRERRKDDIKWEEHLMKDRQRKKETYVNKKNTMSAKELEE